MNNDPKTRELEKEIANLRKLLKKNFTSLNIDLPRQYRSVVNDADLSDSAISNDSDSELQIIETNKNRATEKDTLKTFKVSIRAKRGS